MKSVNYAVLIECLANRLLNSCDLAFKIHHIEYDCESGNMLLFLDVNSYIIVEDYALKYTPTYEKLLKYIENRYRDGHFKR